MDEVKFLGSSSYGLNCSRDGKYLLLTYKRLSKSQEPGKIIIQTNAKGKLGFDFSGVKTLNFLAIIDSATLEIVSEIEVDTYDLSKGADLLWGS